MNNDTAAVDPSYAESVAMTGHAEDASRTFDVRIARFPATGQGTLWIYLFIDGTHYALVDESLSLTSAEATDVTQPDVRFELTGRSSACLDRFDRNSSGMRGHLMARSLLHPSAHPEPGIGGVRVAIEARFEARHSPIAVRSGRIEVMGRATANININGRQHSIEVPAKWHEQTGRRARFAPAFTYLSAQGDGIGIMVTRHANGAWGYLYRDGTTTAVTGLDISPYGKSERAFSVTLEDGTGVNGTAAVVREVSVPIEGSRRPGATVIVDSDLGRLVGVLNDWQPSR